MTPAEYEELQDKIEHTEKKVHRIEGALNQVNKQLESKFKIKSIKEAKKLITTIDYQIEEKEETFSQGLKELEEYDGRVEKSS